MSHPLHEEGEGGAAPAAAPAGPTTTGTVGNTPGTDTGWGTKPPKLHDKKLVRRKITVKEFLEMEDVSEAHDFSHMDDAALKKHISIHTKNAMAHVLSKTASEKLAAAQKELKRRQRAVREDTEIDEAIKGWKHAHSDIMKSRADAAAASNSVVLHQLRADGKESGMHDARKTFRSEEEAHAHVENIKKLNPTRKYRYNKYVDGQHVGIVESEGTDMSSEIEEACAGKKMPAAKKTKSAKPVSEFAGLESFGAFIGEAASARKLTHIQVRPNSRTHPDHLGKIGSFGDKMDLSDDDQYNKAMSDAHAYGKEKYGEGKYEISHVDNRGGLNYAIRAGSVAKVRRDMKNATGKCCESEQVAEEIISEVEVQGADRYEYTHGKKPKGYGNWYFSKHKTIDFGKHTEGEDHISVRGTYGEAKKQAVKWANEKGHAVVHVQT